MKTISIFYFFFFMIACTYKPKENRLSDFDQEEQSIVNSFYKLNGDTINFKRVLSKDSEIVLQEGKLYFGKYALTQQTLNRHKTFRNSPTISDSLTTSFNGEGFQSKIGDGRDVMFVQIVPDSSMSTADQLKFLNLRGEIEGKIDDEVKGDHSGEWFAGDMGAGANMLFFIDDWDKATVNVMRVLKENSLLNHVIIAKRIPIKDGDWNYEIVYPVNFQGVFNSM